MQTITKEIFLQDSCLRKSRAIAKQLAHYSCNNNPVYQGVLAGLSGEALFLLYAAQLHQEQQYYDRGYSLLQQTLDGIRTDKLVHTHCSGLAGLGWALMHLEENQFLDIDVNELLNDLDGYLERALFHDLHHGNYDFLHGAVGTALYFLKRMRYNSQTRAVLEDFVPALQELATQSNDTLKWESVLNAEGKRVYNISLSHGMSSIVALLSKLHAADVAKAEAEGMLQEAVHYILQQELPAGHFSSCFPSYSLESERGTATSSRLAWCYGDLGIASALWMAGQALGNGQWRDKSVEIFRHAARRTDLQAAGVVDAGLCHGTAGIAHIFNRAYHQTSLPELESTRDYWLQQTLQMATYEDGLAGYKTYGGKIDGYKNETNLLEGVAGIGLAFMAAVDSTYLSWDECLLLS